MREYLGMSKTRFYRLWIGMKSRCNNPKYTNHHGKGIKYCPEWESFSNFYKDMFSTYFDGATLDRIDNSGDYSKENCRWETHSVQNHNKSKRCGGSLPIGCIESRNKTKYNVNIQKGSQRISVGTFRTIEEAAIAFDNASEYLYGDRPNGTIKQEVDKVVVKKPLGSFSKVIGVSKDKDHYRARFTLPDKTRVNVGSFYSEIDAAIAYDNAYEKVYGIRPNKTNPMQQHCNV